MCDSQWSLWGRFINCWQVTRGLGINPMLCLTAPLEMRKTCGKDYELCRRDPLVASIASRIVLAKWMRIIDDSASLFQRVMREMQSVKTSDDPRCWALLALNACLLRRDCSTLDVSRTGIEFTYEVVKWDLPHKPLITIKAPFPTWSFVETYLIRQYEPLKQWLDRAIVIDIGANAGDSALWFLHHGAYVYAIEPTDLGYIMLNTTLLKNKPDDPSWLADNIAYSLSKRNVCVIDFGGEFGKSCLELTNTSYTIPVDSEEECLKYKDKYSEPFVRVHTVKAGDLDMLIKNALAWVVFRLGLQYTRLILKADCEGCEREIVKDPALDRFRIVAIEADREVHRAMLRRGFKRFARRYKVSFYINPRPRWYIY